MVSIYWFVMICFLLISSWNLIALSTGQEIILNSVAVLFVADLDEDLVTRLFPKETRDLIIQYYISELDKNEVKNKLKKGEKCCNIPCCWKNKAVGITYRSQQTNTISLSLFITCIVVIAPLASTIFMYYQNASHCVTHFAYTRNVEQCFWPKDLGGKQDPFNINLWNNTT